MARRRSSWGQEMERLYKLLEEADMQRFFDPLQRIGVEKVEHLSDMDDADFTTLGISNVERNRLTRMSKSGTVKRAKALWKRVIPSVARRSKTVTLNEEDTMLPSGLPSWAIPDNRVTAGNFLSGTFGSVGCVQEGQLSNEYGSSVPVVLLTIVQSCQQHRAFAQQAALLLTLNENSIVRFFGVASIGPVSYVVMEQCSRGTLSSELQRRGPAFPLLTVFDMAVQIARGLKYLELHNIVHSNLCGRSVYITSTGECKVGEFSLMHSADVLKYLTDSIEAERIRSRLKHKIPYQWAPPEVFGTNSYSLKSVVWSYGALLWEMFSHGAELWPKLNTMEILEQISPPRQNRLAKPCHCPVDIYSLMQRCWKQNPEDRPSFTGLETLVGECYPQLAKVTCGEEIMGDGAAGMLSLVPGDKLTIVEKQAIYWFAQNQHGDYGEFRYDCVEVITDAKNVSPAPERRTSANRMPGDGIEAANISEPINFKHDFHMADDINGMTDEELAKMFEAKTRALKEGTLSPSMSTPNMSTCQRRAVDSPVPDVPGTTANSAATRSSASLHRAWTATQLQKPAPRAISVDPTSPSSSAPAHGGVSVLSALQAGARKPTSDSSISEYDELDSGLTGPDSLEFDPEGEYLDMGQGQSANNLLDYTPMDEWRPGADVLPGQEQPASPRHQGGNVNMSDYTTMGKPRSGDDSDTSEYVEAASVDTTLADYTTMGAMAPEARAAIGRAIKENELTLVAMPAAGGTEPATRQSMEVNRIYSIASPTSPPPPAVAPKQKRPVPAKRQRTLAAPVPKARAGIQQRSASSLPQAAEQQSTGSCRMDVTMEPAFLRVNSDSEGTAEAIHANKPRASADSAASNSISSPIRSLTPVPGLLAATTPATCDDGRGRARSGGSNASQYENVSPAALPSPGGRRTPEYLNVSASRDADFADNSISSLVNITSLSIGGVSQQSTRTVDSEDLAIQHRYINDKVRSSSLLEQSCRQRADSNDYQAYPNIGVAQHRHSTHETAQTASHAATAATTSAGDTAVGYDRMKRGWGQERNDSEEYVPPALSGMQRAFSVHDYGPETPPLSLCADMSALPDGVGFEAGAGPMYNHLDRSPQPAFTVMQPYQSADPIPYYSADPVPYASTPPVPPKASSRSAATAMASDSNYTDIPSSDSRKPGGAAGINSDKSATSPQVRSRPAGPSPLVGRRSSVPDSPQTRRSGPETPTVFANNLVQQLPDLKFADVMVALQAYDSPQSTEAHLRAQLVLDVFNRLHEMGYCTVDMGRCELAMKHCQWKKERATEYLVENMGRD